MPQARDEAGNIWEVDAQGNAVRLIQPAQQQMPNDPTYQYEGQKAAADATKATNQAAASGYDPAIAQAELAVKQAQADNSAREASTKASAENRESTKFSQEQQGGRNTLRLLQQGIDNLDKIYNDSFKGKGLQSIGESYAPGVLRPANPRLNTASNSLSSTVARALQLTGQQFNTPAEAEMFIGGMLPKNDDPDEVIVDKILRLKNVYEGAAQTAAIGGEYKPRYDLETGSVLEVSRDNAGGTDATQQRMTDGSQGGRMAPAKQGFETINNPDLAGVNDEVYNMLRSGSSAAEIGGYLQGRGINPIPLMGAIQKNVEIQQTNPGVRPYIEVEQMQREISPEQQVLSNLADTRGGAYGVGAANALTAGQLDELAGGSAQQTKEYLRQQYPGMSFAGDVTGGAMALLPIGRGVQAGARAIGLGGNAARSALAGDIAYGAAYGAGENNENRLLGAGIGAVAGGIGSTLGSAAANSIGRGVRGVSDGAVNRLNQSGVPMTLGQMLGQSGRIGPMLKGAEDRLSGLPFIGDAINARRMQGLQKFNQNAFDDALEPIGATVGGIGEDGVREAQDAVSNAYTNTLSGVNISPDERFAQEMIAANTAGKNVPKFGDDFASHIENDLTPIAGTSDAISGQQLQDMLRTTQGLRRTYNNMAGGIAPQPTARYVADAFGRVGDALEGVTSRQAPEVMPDLLNANAANRRLSILEDVVGDSAKNTDGIFTPAQLGMKDAQNTKRFLGKKANARGDRPFFQMQRDAQNVLPSKVPDSGTAGRVLIPGGLAAASAGANEYSSGAGAGLGALAALAALSSRTGGAVAQKALLARPEVAKQLGGEIIRRRRFGGLIGAPAMLSLQPR